MEVGYATVIGAGCSVIRSVMIHRLEISLLNKLGKVLLETGPPF